MLRISGSNANIERRTFGEIKPLSAPRLLEIAADDQFCTVQLFSPLTDEEAQLLNACIFATRPDIKLNIRFWDAEGICDLSLMRHLKHVRKVHIVDAVSAIHLDALAHLEQLELLVLDIPKCRDYSFLNELSPHIHTLGLELSESKINFTYGQLLRFPALSMLLIKGRKKDIHEVASLPGIRSLILRGITVEDYRFIQEMPDLHGLSIQMGASKDFSALHDHNNLRILELWQISHLSDIGFAAKLPQLEWLYLHQLKHVQAMPNFSQSTHLHTIMLNDLKNLVDYAALKSAPSLAYFRGFSTKTIPADRFIPVLQNPSLQGFYFGMANDKETAKLDSYIRQYMQTTNQPPAWKKFAVSIHG